MWALMWFVGSSWSSITLSAPVHVSLVYMHRKGDKQEEMQKIPFCHSILWFFLQAWETRSQHAATGSLNHNQQFSLQITNVPASGGRFDFPQMWHIKVSGKDLINVVTNALLLAFLNKQVMQYKKTNRSVPQRGLMGKRTRYLVKVIWMLEK